MYLKRYSFSALLCAGALLSSSVVGQSINKVFINGEFIGEASRIDNYAGAVFHGGGAALNISYGSAIAWTDGQSVAQLVNRASPFPPTEGATFTGFVGPGRDGNSVIFSGNSNNEGESGANGGNYGLFRWNGEAVETVVSNALALTNGEGTGTAGFSGFRGAAKNVVFSAYRGTGDVYRAHYLLADGETTLIADSNTNIPGTEGTFGTYQVSLNISDNGEHVAFFAFTDVEDTGFGMTDAGPTIFRYAGGEIIPVASVGATLASGGTIQHIQNSRPAIANDGSIYFEGRTASTNGMFVAHPDGSLDLHVEGGVQLLHSDGAGVYFRGMRTGDSPTILIPSLNFVDADGTVTRLLEFPVTLDGIEWRDATIFDANPDGVLFELISTDSRKRGLFTTAAFGTPVAGGSTESSFWSEYESFGDWRISAALGWIHDATFPYIYSLVFESWLYVEPAGGLDGFYFYNYADGSWYFTVETFGGWVYQYHGPDAGWRYIF